MKLDIFGRMTIEVLRSNGEWLAYRLGNEGKKRLLNELKIPSQLSEHDLPAYVEDIYHEWATLNKPSVKRLDP